ncbi:alpha/beta fold hydrolase [Haliscomenobacter hydrossis]|uniref:Tropinesterase n=1 Tax=Haliscomenobacter hydrossis (strain ATCC 27775 / DSM 1100 / LMG 10767 / O) TaxID=760192 RepID=F4L2V8_HALH1|nr:alpha/beta hydrolase [Haliscomenobacter hydrossis]AEE49638.1 Tropinesterase [Haliscomenobacter hydrossis DSM 1100]
MKISLLTLVLALPLLLCGQKSLRPDAFNKQKKSVLLRTGITMKYVEKGNPKGAPIIFLHGYTDSSRSFQQVLDSLEKTNPQFRLLAPDLRGHGASSMPNEKYCASNPEQCFSMAAFAADIVAFMDQLKIERAHLVGHSMGSVIAQELATKHSKRINGVVLIGTLVDAIVNTAITGFLRDGLLEETWRKTLEQKPGFRWPADAWKLTPTDVGEEAMQFLQSFWVVDPVASDSFVQSILPETAHTHLGTWIGVIRELAHFNSEQALLNLKKPTLILWATQDNMFPEAPDQAVVKRAFQAAAEKNGNLVYYKTYGKMALPASGMQENDLGHNLHWGAPGAVAEDIAEFLLTGKPKINLPYADPQNIKKVRTDGSSSNVIIWSKNSNVAQQ